MLTPCVKKCKLKYDVCTGCARHIFDIVNWKKYTDNEREIIMGQIEDINSIKKRLEEYYNDELINEWLTKPHPMLDDMSAIDTIKSGNLKRVQYILDRLDDSAYV